MGNKNNGENISKNLSGKYNQKLLDHAKKSATDALKLLQKESFKKQQKQLVIWLVTKSLTELRNLQKIHSRTIQKQLQISLIKKYQNKDISPEERQEIIDELRLK